MSTPPRRLILIGGNRKDEDGPLLPFALAARERGFQVRVVSEPLHLDLPTADGRPLRARLAEAGIEATELIELDPARLAELAGGGEAAGLMVNGVWLIKRSHLDALPRLFNYHNARLPEERGAAAYSWKILSGSRQGGLTIHRVTERLDDGDIVLEQRFDFPDGCRTCADFYREMAPRELELFGRFLDGLERGDLAGTVQDEGASLYWPRLLTDVHGYIDWSWSAADIQIFTEAFDAPHPGASTFLDGVRLRFKGCRATTEFGRFHPFQAGLVVRKAADHLLVAATGGALEVREVTGPDGERRNDSIRLGSRFITPRAILEDALASRAIYKGDGVTVRVQTSPPTEPKAP